MITFILLSKTCSILLFPNFKLKHRTQQHVSTIGRKINRAGSKIEKLHRQKIAGRHVGFNRGTCIFSFHDPTFLIIMSLSRSSQSEFEIDKKSHQKKRENSDVKE
jgi:hypothetical protein